MSDLTPKQQDLCDDLDAVIDILENGRHPSPREGGASAPQLRIGPAGAGYRVEYPTAVSAPSVPQPLPAWLKGCCWTCGEVENVISHKQGQLKDGDPMWHPFVPIPVAPSVPQPQEDVLLAPCRWCAYNGAGYWQAGTHGSGCPWRFIGGESERRQRLAVMPPHPTVGLKSRSAPLDVDRVRALIAEWRRKSQQTRQYHDMAKMPTLQQTPAESARTVAAFRSCTNELEAALSPKETA